MSDSELGRTLAAAAFSRIRADILGSRLLPGTRLRFEPLKKAYGVGLSPLREALSRLVVSGLVTAEGQRGFRVAPASIEDIQDISDVRTNVECLAFRQSIERGDDQWQADVVAAHYRLNLLVERNAIEPVDEEVWEARHLRSAGVQAIPACRTGCFRPTGGGIGRTDRSATTRFAKAIASRMPVTARGGTRDAALPTLPRRPVR